MEFWRNHMPPGMLLRSGVGWHLDPDGRFTLERFFLERGENPAAVKPISRETYLNYTDWFTNRADIAARPARVTAVRREDGGFRVTLDDGSRVLARRVVVATGFYSFAHIPPALLALTPPGRIRHTRDAVDPGAYRDRRVLIVGGRQSAFEWAALLSEAGAARIDLSYRHDTPRFTPSDWSWVEPLVDGMVDNPSWFRQLSDEQQEEHRAHLWREGRLQLEPWLENRIAGPQVRLHPRTQVNRVALQPDGSLLVGLDSGKVLPVDEVIAATGYQVDIRGLPFLDASLVRELAVEQGFPVLDPAFQSSVPGLYFSSLPASRTFGPFFGFTIAVRSAARIIGSALERTEEGI